MQLPRQLEYNLCLREVKKILMVAVARIRDKKFLHEALGQESGIVETMKIARWDVLIWEVQ